MSCWGGLLSRGASLNGVRGVVADGACRDVAEAREYGFPVFARSVTVLGTVKRFAGDLGVPVRVGGITVYDGDLVVGDADGVVAIPAAAAAEVIARADRRVVAEKRILEQVRAGASTVDIYDLPGTVRS